jgi:hypothetical protein
LFSRYEDFIPKSIGKRTCILATSDGNCIFSAFSIALYGSEDGSFSIALYGSEDESFSIALYGSEDVSFPPFLLLDSSIHSQIIRQLEGGRHNYANK